MGRRAGPPELMEAKLIKFAADQFEAKPIRSRFIIPYNYTLLIIQEQVDLV